MNIHTHRRLITWLLALATVLAAAYGLWWLAFHQPKTDIRTQNPGVENFAAGRVTEGANTGTVEELKTTSALTYESAPRTADSPTTNAVGILWDQEGESGEVWVEARTHDGKQWSRWVNLGEGDDLKDGSTANSAILLSDNTKQVQYRFVLTAGDDGRSPAVSRPRLSLIDSTRGPDPTKKSPLAKLFGGTATATATGPSIYTRMDWGSPEGDSSPRWPPEYIVPDEAVVHHTAATVNPNSSAAAIRGIWDYHANTQGWGDIGYNYLVDLNGNIWQGRFHNVPYARQINQDVVGGHTLGGHNYHSTGIATLGNFTDQGVTYAMLDSVGKIAGWKAMFYGTWNPGGRTFGHRDFDYTNCPGNNLYNNLYAVRNAAGGYFDYYSKWQQYDYSYQGQGVGGSPGTALSLRPGQTTTAYLDLKNEGTAAWSNQQVRLGTWNPRDRGSGFRDSSWISAARPGTFVGKVVSGSVTAASSIAPGETARFQFTVGNQGVGTGTYLEYFQPLAEGYTWFIRNAGINWQMSSVGDVYTYQWMGQTYTQPTEPGQTASLQLDAKNTGNVNWLNTGSNPVRLGTYRPRDRASNFYDSSWANTIRPATFAGQVDGGVLNAGDGTVEPGNTARFVFTFKAPTRPVVTTEYFNLLAEGKAWMNDVGISWPVNTPQNYGAQFAGQSAAPTIDKSDGGIGSMYFDYKNTGTYPWRKSTGIVKLAPNRPNDHVSPFAAAGLSGGQLPANTANWLSGSRVATFVGQVNGGSLDTADAVIEPNATGRFYMALDARNVAVGTYNEYVNLVAEFFAWMPDIGVHLPVTVTP